MTGKVLGGRYELIELIGKGGMAVVYKARCSYLKRYVAVKILKQEYAEDQEFVKRFRIEAQSAASLSHSNIVSIHDVGQDDSIYYIVMEYVEGNTLKDYIKDKSLSWEDSVSITLKISSAIKKAHENRIIHRDIKPQNILMTKDGEPKVTDFGIAQAVSVATATISADTVGSVHYSSPEQSRGGYTDEKSDIYSLGITLYEMVTGKLPFDGDNAVTVALKHIDKKPLEPININVDIPKKLNSIILKAIAKQKAQRYQNIGELISDLKNIDDENSDDVNLNVLTSGRKKVIGDDDLRRRKPTYSGASKRKPSSSSPKTYKKKKSTSKSKRGKNSGSNRSTSSRIVVLVLYLFLIIAICGSLYLAYNKVFAPIIANLFQEKVVEIKLKDYEGWNIDNAIKDLEVKNIVYTLPKYEFNDKYEEGIVISQSEKANTIIKENNLIPIQFVVSKGSNLVKIPKTTYKDAREVEKLLRDEYGLIPNIIEVFDDVVGLGYVIKTEPSVGNEVKVGSEITIYESRGIERINVLVPELKGLTLEEAKAILLSKELTLGQVFPLNQQGNKGKISNQAPDAGSEVPQDSAITIYFEDEETENIGEVGENRVKVNYVIPLSNPDSYGDEIKIRIHYVPSDTQAPTKLKEVTLSKSEFPLSVLVPVPENGHSLITIYINNKWYKNDEILP